MINSIPFNIRIPVTLCNLKLTFHITENIRLAGSRWISSPHSHKDWELKYMTSGSGNQIVETTDVPLRSGDLLLLHPGQMHYNNVNENSADCVQYNFRISMRKSDDPSSLALLEILEATEKIHDDRFTLAPLFNRMWKEITERKPGYFNYAQALCLSIFVEFLRLTGMDTDLIFTTDGEKCKNYWRTRLDKYLYYNFDKAIKLDDLAEEIALSPRHASRMIEREYGLTFIEKLTEIRLDNAKYRLKNTSDTMEAIAVACGFQSYSYFTTCFKKNVGMTPGQYRSKFSSKD